MTTLVRCPTCHRVTPYEMGADFACSDVCRSTWAAQHVTPAPPPPAVGARVYVTAPWSSFYTLRGVVSRVDMAAGKADVLFGDDHRPVAMWFGELAKSGGAS